MRNWAGILVAVVVGVAVLGGSRFQLDARPKTASPALRVCADPNNLPFSNRSGAGFENRLAEMLARDLATTVEYTWWAQRRGFIRNTLNARLCDVVMGYPTDAEMAATTKPYYRSTYVFVTRRNRRSRIHSFDDVALRKLRIGVQLIGDDGANSPPAHSLSRRGIVHNLVGYTVYGDYRTNSPPSDIIAAVTRGDVDIAAAWGPLAGYFAAQQSEPLDVVPVTPQLDGAFLPQAFDISIAIRRHEPERLARFNHFIDEHRLEIEKLLDDYHVPRAPRETRP
jgi:mxaJ protein